MLTKKQLEVLQLLAEMREQEIADYLCVSLHTIHEHTAQIYRKLNVRSRTAAVYKAYQLGLIEYEQFEINRKTV